MVKRAKLAAIFGLVAALMVMAHAPARAATFMADLSHRLIAITTAFSGSDVLLFGTTGEPGSEVAVVIRGPAAEMTIRRKTKVGPLWLNTDEITFDDVPGFYAVASSVPLEQLAPEHELARHQIGLKYMRFRPADAEAAKRPDLDEFVKALIRNKQRERLYNELTTPVRFVGNSLFRSTISFPGNVPPGTYQVEVFNIRDGIVVAAQSSVLVISKAGMEAEIYDIAQNKPIIYGLASIILAIGAGWSASAIFKK